MWFTERDLDCITNMHLTLQNFAQPFSHDFTYILDVNSLYVKSTGKYGEWVETEGGFDVAAFSHSHLTVHIL